MTFETLSWLIIGIALGVLLSFLTRQIIIGRKLRAAQMEAQKLLAEAKDKRKETILEAKEEAIKIRASAEADYRERRSELQRQEKRLSQKEENLDRRIASIERQEHSIAMKEKEAESTRIHLDELRQKQIKQLELIGGISSAEAKEILFRNLEEEVRKDSDRRLYELEIKLKEEADKRGREILASAIQRCAADVASETTVSVVPLPNDEMKGRIIGREGRNIRAIEHATGVELIIDDTPESVTLSCFDPVRREIARVALGKLILDGRIHPARIEEVVQKTSGEIEDTIRSEGERAAYEVGVHGLPPELIRLLGRLKYRFSYGQNVLKHSIEVAHLGGMIAAELGADVGIATRAGLLHDIGKAVDFEVTGTHAAIGANLVKQWERSPKVVNAIAEHHDETECTSVESFIVSAADAISGARPGARLESLDQYLKRLEALENIANSFPGVEKSYAIQAGREVRIMVKPGEVDDIGAMRLARDIVKKVEESLQYPGQIKVTVIRETRATEYAK
jgi:ribonuclease Y